MPRTPIPLLVTNLTTKQSVEYATMTSFIETEFKNDRKTYQNFQTRVRRSQSFDYLGFHVTRLDHLDKIIPITSKIRTKSARNILGFNYFTFEQAIGTLNWWHKEKLVPKKSVLIRLTPQMRKRKSCQGWVFCYEDEFDGVWFDKDQLLEESSRGVRLQHKSVMVKDYATGLIDEYEVLNHICKKYGLTHPALRYQMLCNKENPGCSLLFATSKVAQYKTKETLQWPEIAQLRISPHTSGFSLHKNLPQGGYGPVLKHFKTVNELAQFTKKSRISMNYHFSVYTKLELPNNEVIIRNDSPEAVFLRQLRKQHGLD